MTETDLTSTDFLTLLKRAKKIHDLINEEYPSEHSLNIMSTLFCFLLFNSGLVPLGNILSNVGNLHDTIMLARGTNELEKMLDELKAEEDKEEVKH